MPSSLARLPVFALAGLFALPPLSNALSSESGIASCLERQSPIKQLFCLADLAKKAKSARPCRAAKKEGVRWQCFAILAEYQKDASLCESIPRTDEAHQDLYDACLSDVAAARQDPELCSGISADGIRDSCYLKVVKGGAPSTLCARIKDAGLKSACTGHPIQIQ